ncbi:MAG: MBL fold metallo-hydrolase [Lewinellaceae bacterium]|nr:MBL fold metallo-hydrolase [Lewinellaceae bacterium]
MTPIFLISFVALAAPLAWYYVSIRAHFGGRLTTAQKDAFRQSRQWTGDKFENSSPTKIDLNVGSIPGLIRANIQARKFRAPEHPLPVLPLDQERYLKEDTRPLFTWFGHSALLLRLNGKNLLIDPMLGPDSSPIAPFATRRFSENTLDLINQLPPIDAVLLTHDHYDHLDYESIKRLRPIVNTWLVALGTARHLEAWGIPADQITEFDWWQQAEFAGITLTFTPSRHFSGRGPFDRFQSLWGGWVFQTPQYRIYWSGDGGYDTHFQEIGEQYGPFDWAFMECGQYNELWRQIHLHPEEAVQAAIEAKANVAIPVHWGAFSLAVHPWREPVEWFVAEAEQKGLGFCTPRLGETVVMGEEPGLKWWETTI